MIDIHTHILPGIDDGPATLAESIQIARSAISDGTRVVAATPHVRDDYPTRPEIMQRGVLELRRALKDANIELDVLPGGEVALDHLRRVGVEGVRPFALAGGDRYLLVEVPYEGWPLDLGMHVAALGRAGMTPVLAHPERNPEVQARPDRLAPLVHAGARVQITAGSVNGLLGRRSREAAFALLRLGLAHLLASDAHAPSVRQVGMSAAVHALGDGELARRLVEDAPGAILAGSPLPGEGPRLRRRGAHLASLFRRC